MTGIPEGAITSPNYPEPYTENSYCEWRISASRGSTIQLRFNDLDLEGLGNCYFDSIEVHSQFEKAEKFKKYNHETLISSHKGIRWSQCRFEATWSILW